MKETKNNPAATADREILITRVFDAPRELVWQAMTDPQRVVHWWGPRGFSTTIEKMDVRPGGVWKHVMRGPDGTEYPNESVFQEVVKPERIVYLHGGGKAGGARVQSEATWTFEALDDGKTRVTIHMVFPSAAERDQVVKEYNAVEGGQQTLARLGEQLAKTPVIVERTYDAPVAAVWRAITDYDEMKRWYFPDLKGFKAEVGFETQFDKHFNDTTYVHLWKVTEVVPGKKITYRWKYDGYAGESHVTFELFAEGDKTKLKLTHAGLETFAPETNPIMARGNFLKGWTQIIGAGLAAYFEKPADRAAREFVISRTFDAPRDLVWRAWTEPKHMAQWWGPRDFTNPVCEMDVRPGGKYRIVMRAPDGAEYPMEGSFREVAKPERLVLFMDCSGHPESWHDMVNPNRDRTKKPTLDCTQTITFEDLGGKTKLTVRTTLETAAIRDAMVKMGMNEGWSGSLERLQNLLAKMP